jgi:WD40 repeat protein
MTTPRVGHTATLLPDGRVLIAGGYAASAELYDPTTGKFTATGKMTTARTWHMASLLPNGTVLVAGGDVMGSIELYDPSSGTFSALGTPGALTTSPVLFDPSTDTVTPTGSLYSPSGGLFSTATWLPDGRVLLNGGKTSLLLPDGMVLTVWDGVYPGTYELYDPGTATSRGSVLVEASQALLPNGKILVAGGNDDPGDSNLAWVYNPSTGTSTPTGNMTAFRADDPATLLTDGTVLIAGDNGDAGLTLASAELYDPATGTFTRTGDMTVDRGMHTATLLNNGSVLIAGGIHNVAGQGWPPLSSAEIYTPASVGIPPPNLFSLSGDGRGQGAVWSVLTGSVVSPAAPAAAGDVLSMYTTGLFDGGTIPPQVIVGGRLAEILYFGAAPGYPDYNQINFRVPGGVAPGIAVPVRLTYLGRSSNTVTIGMQ